MATELTDFKPQLGSNSEVQNFSVAAAEGPQHARQNPNNPMPNRMMGSSNESTFQINQSGGNQKDNFCPEVQPTNKSSADSAFGCFRSACGCQYNPNTDKLEYDYTYDDTAPGSKPQPLPRIRQRGEYYVDSYNGDSFNCSFGTNEEAGIWMNSGDQAGTIMAALVWLLMIYSAMTVTSLTITEGIPPILGMIYTLLVGLALSSHAKTSLTDPGSVPKNAVPMESQRRDSTSHSMCGQCQTFKPPMSHHCRICNRCVSRMDHHCPWMNNCVGAANLSEFD